MSTPETDVAQIIPKEDRILMALRLLGIQSARWAALLLGFALATMTTFRPSWQGASVAGAFMLICCLPLWMRRGGA